MVPLRIYGQPSELHFGWPEGVGYLSLRKLVPTGTRKPVDGARNKVYGAGCKVGHHYRVCSRAGHYSIPDIHGRVVCAAGMTVYLGNQTFAGLVKVAIEAMQLLPLDDVTDATLSVYSLELLGYKYVIYPL